MRKNKAELVRFTHFTDEDVCIVDGPGPWPDAKVYLMGPARFKLSWKKLVLAQPRLRHVVGDETHMFWATHGSGASNALYAAMQELDGFVGMTGSWVKGRLSSTYPLIHVIEPNYYASYENFLKVYKVTRADGSTAGWKNPERIGDIAARHAIRRSFESIDGPESKVIITEVCEMKPLQHAAYKEFEKFAILELDDAFLEGKSGGVHAMRCCQIMAHPETFGLAEGEVTGKDELLAIHLSNHQVSGKPGAVFARFVPEQERIFAQIQATGMTVALMNGSTPAKKRMQIDEDYVAGRIQWIVGSPPVAAVGFNWGHTDHVIFTTLNYEDADFYQAYRRFIRGKRSTPLLISVLEYESSLDQKIMQIIEKKSLLASKVDGREVFELSAA